MNNIFSKIASLLAFVIGVMAVVAGGKVLLGNDPGYYVIDWVPVYNFTAGVITAFLTSVLIWKGSPSARPAAIATLGMHTLVMILLQTAFRDVVASESLRAMTIRISAWLVILVLMWVQGQKDKVQANGTKLKLRTGKTS